MYVRVVRNVRPGAPAYEATYECTECRVSPRPDHPDQASVVLTSPDGLVLDCVIDKTTCCVYLMNDHGKNFDKYDWMPEKNAFHSGQHKQAS